ncbi:hypothetical protein HK102_011443, partial [Quaeritorhiza haematococci]
LIFRAESLTGPYEGRVALRDQGVAQGGLVDTPEGKWYALLFQDHGAVGRIPFLVPVTWEDGWPVMGVDGKVPATLNLPASTLGVRGIVGSDDFDRRPGDPPLPLAWQWNHNPDDEHWSITQRPGSAVVTLDVAHMNDGDVAGLAALQKRYGFVGVRATGDARSLVMVIAEADSPTEVEVAPLAQDTVFLRLECDFRGRKDTARFAYSLDGASWSEIGKPLRMTYTRPHFMGYRFALFHFATTTPGGFVDFDDFRISDRIDSPE